MLGVKSKRAQEDIANPAMVDDETAEPGMRMPVAMTQHMLYSHQQYIIEYNEDRIVGVSVNQTEPIMLRYNTSISNDRMIREFYSVKWIENTSINYYNRFEKYLDKDFFEHHIHWFSIFNSFMMVVFLTGLVAMIMMRALRKDYMRYNKDEDDAELMERDAYEESGWKLVHGDVFRPVEHIDMLATCLGTGMQLVALTALLIIFAIAGELWASRGAMATCVVFSWAFTSFINGYISGGFYARNDGKDWVLCMLYTAVAFPLTCFSVGFVVNCFAIYWGALAAIPFGTVIILFMIWGLISFPLTLAGTVIGRNWAGVADLPCRVKRIPSPIPPTPFYFHPIAIGIFGGILPFGSIFIELYFIMTSFWSFKVYYVFGFLLLTYVILLIVTSCISIVGTYFLLNAENYHWHWTSFASGASTAVYVMGYCTYFFKYKTKMHEPFQTVYFFGYSFLMSLSVGLACGAIAYLASSVFVKRIYRNVKCD